MWFIVFKHIAYALFSIILSNFAADFQSLTTTKDIITPILLIIQKP